MSYYYGQQTAPAAMPVPSPSNHDISCIIEPVSGKGGVYVGNITAAKNNELLTGNQFAKQLVVLRLC